MSSNAESIARRAKLAFEESESRLSSLPSSSSSSSSQNSASADAARRSALLSIRDALSEAKEEIQAANAADVEAANELVKQGKLSKSLASRLDLFAKKGKWEAMIEGVEQVANLTSPLDVCTFAKRLADADAKTGLGAVNLYRITCPIGVLLCIFEARPEVIINIASLAIKSGNAAILKGGKESKQTAAVMSRVLSQALADTPLPKDLVQTVETREEIAELLHQDRYIDLVIPRGSNELVRSIQREARMPVMGHADGLCIGYLHEDAEESLSVGTIVDSKIDYPAACNALETLLVHRSQLSKPIWPAIAKALVAAGVTLHCDSESLSALSSLSNDAALKDKLVPAKAEDYDTEFLDLDLAVKTVDGVDQAIDHINAHGSHHTDLILCAPLSADGKAQNPAAVRFTSALSSANVYVNASTRFADGFRYGFGTEVGISTGRTHARGPVGLDGLVIYKYIVKGDGSGPQKVADFNAGRPWAHQDVQPEYPRF